MATIDFLPVCSHCHQVLWDETINVTHNIHPARCPYCKEPITSVTMSSRLPYYCESLRPIKIEENKNE